MSNQSHHSSTAMQCEIQYNTIQYNEAFGNNTDYLWEPHVHVSDMQ
jgi:hypothetical protein